MTLRKKILVLGSLYTEDLEYQRGFIGEKWINKVSDELNLKELSDDELADMWDMVYLTLDNECLVNRLNGDYEEMDKWMDVKSAFVEVVNHEARQRRGGR